MLSFPPTRRAAFERLARFVPKAGRAYTAKRNYDLPGHPHVSGLSPYIRHRALTEAEVLEATLARFSPSTAEKFIQEVYWRTYWKGWLELRPEIWARYQLDLDEALAKLDADASLGQAWRAATEGNTGIDCFDSWAHELCETGYLHNHARMWFASIWIFTLELPWVLGADFFLRHLLDGDPASNTLGWRWVAGLQTRGKTYLARPDNIARYTDGRFHPKGLAREARALEDAPFDAAGPMPITAPASPGQRTGFLLHYEDLSPTAIARMDHQAAAILSPRADVSPLKTSASVTGFRTALTDDAAARYGLAEAPRITAADIASWAEREGLTQVVTAHAPVGPIAGELATAERACAIKGVRILGQVRAHDATCWPHATKGFFKFKEQIPNFLRQRDVTHAA